METFLVLGICFILYEALDFFQGCIHSATPNTSDQIDAYRRQLDEQRQKIQEEQFLANLTPLLSAQLAAAGFTITNDPNSTSSTASIISELKNQVLQQRSSIESYSTSVPILNGASGGFRPAYRASCDTQPSQNSSSLPRDYNYLQQQQFMNKTSNKSILSKLSTTSDNRIFPENPCVLGVPNTVITIQPASQNLLKSTDAELAAVITVPPTATPSLLPVDAERAVITKNNNNNNNNNNNSNNNILPSPQKKSYDTPSPPSSEENDKEENDITDDSSSTSGSASLTSATSSFEHDFVDDRTLVVGSCSSSLSDFREIECERMRRQCVSVKRIYSISEKF